MSEFLGKTHEENRGKVCAPCGKKIKYGGKSANRFLITDKICERIKCFIDPDFSTQNSKFPIGICATCSTTLVEHEKGINKRPLPPRINYEDIHLKKDTRSGTFEICTCYICLTARCNYHKKPEYSRHEGRQFNTIIDEHNGKYGKEINSKLSIASFDDNNPVKIDKISKSISLCSKCYQPFGKGKMHSCSDKSMSVASIKNILENLPQKQVEQVVSSVVKDLKSKEVPEKSSIVLSNERGKPTVLYTKSISNKNDLFSNDDLDNFAVNSNSSVRGLRKLTNFIRSKVGRNSVPKRYAEHFTEKQRKLDYLYKSDTFSFDTSKSKEQRPVIWADATDLVEAVVEARKFIGFYSVKLMADGGGDFFKLCLTILPEDYSSEECEQDCFEEPSKKRTKLYAEGGSAGCKAKLTSVKRTIILGIVPDIKETYENVKILFDLTKINDVSFKMVCDFKLMLLVNGMQTATSTFPCPYCFVTLKELRCIGEDHSENADCEKSVSLKTYGDLRKDFYKFESMKKVKKFAPECHSTVNLPLLTEADDVCVLEKCIIPELHVLLGFVNHLFWDGLVPILTEPVALLWPKKLNLVTKNYHGRQFEGNACRVLLKSADMLKDKDICGEVGELRVLPFINAFKAMDKIVGNCFSTKKIEPETVQNLNKLNKILPATEISKTLKIHVLLDHFMDCVNFLDGDGLGNWSEQAGESIHHEFLIHWNRRKVSSFDNPSYINQLKSAVISFSSLNL